MALPKKLRDFNLFGDGDVWQGQIAECAIPKLVRKMEEYRGNGMDGTVELDMGNEKIEFDWTAAGLIVEVFDDFGTSKLDKKMIRFAGAYVRDDIDQTVAVEIVIRGRHKEIDMGTAKPGEDNQIKVMTAVAYYKLIIDGEEIIEIDVIGYVFKVRGVDMLAAKRKALGM
jgi:P2 family phage contractile tail tube protein